MSAGDLPAIELRALRKSFGRTDALGGLHLAVPANSVFGFLGPNGAGKSTTMKIIMGLIRPTSGSARVLGFDVERDGIEVRSRVGYLPQHPAYPANLTVRGVLGLAARLRRVPDRSGDLLSTVGLGDLADRRVRGLSGGEAQRLGVAQALVGDPDVLILDEPSAGLDPAGRREIFELLDGLRERATIFYSTHLLDDVARLSDTIAVLDHGEIVADGPIDEFMIGTAAASWRVRLTGPSAAAVLEAAGAEPWVDQVEVLGDGLTEIHLNDRASGERQLLRTLCAAGGEVTEFRPVRRSLEDIYLDLVEEDAGV